MIFKTNLLKKIINLNSSNHNYVYIHIGKCGGSSIRNFLQKSCESKFTFYHLNRPNLKTQNNSNRFLIVIRNPIERYVSAFNHSKNLIDFDISKIRNPEQLSLENCLAPFHIKNKIKNNGIVFSKEYDYLISFFKDANTLAESLSSNNIGVKSKAISLMKNKFEHLYKGIGWYLHNGAFIRKYHSQIIFVGRLEFLKDDINSFSKKYNNKFNLNSSKLNEIRVNTKSYSKYLSEKAINNIISWYSDSDFKAIKKLYKFNLITKNYYEGCFNYYDS
tara:strand:+ start:5697 stop:6521 length:825 start_codon:yes stop_codon:yes gene_type:complete